MTKKAHEITEAEITAVSLVKRGANRSPFKIRKSEESLFMQNLKKSTPPGGNYVAPATGGEEAADTPAKQAARAQVAQNREWESELRAAQYEADQILGQMSPLTVAERAKLIELDRIIRVRQALLGGSTVAKADALDLLITTQQTTGHAGRGGTSQRLEIGPQPSTLSKAEQEANAAFWRDLANDLKGVRRSTPATVKKSAEPTSLDDVTNPLGIRSR